MRLDRFPAFATKRLHEIGCAGEWVAFTLAFLALCSIGMWL